MKRTFSLATETRQFQAYRRSDVVSACNEVSNAIYTQVCKLTYLKSLDTHHWIEVLASLITNNATNQIRGGNFRYDWFFEILSDISPGNAELKYETLDKKYNNIKPDNPDFERLAKNMQDLRARLTDQSAIKGRILTNKEVKEIIESLDLYDGTQD